ncbi:hypothetical protein IMZ11_33835 [Microtetraspora sp. AC03309]|uniref:hypothetical protein n=1 Tax=Microtetraspora sp. AC03309 TaxID=2779376 RepID=UPI001E39D32A|nr:hypothetical protein [Microtetraspora sp. AC03309]MCC5580611.1 hypothetical protein [Microtetraspora sp. AC03309]
MDRPDDMGGRLAKGRHQNHLIGTVLMETVIALLVFALIAATGWAVWLRAERNGLREILKRHEQARTSTPIERTLL